MSESDMRTREAYAADLIASLDMAEKALLLAFLDSPEFLDQGSGSDGGKETL